MSTEVPARGSLTDVFLLWMSTHLDEAGILVGDATKPSGSGWGETPNVGEFVPYLTVGTGPGQRVPSEPDSLAGAHNSWLLAYALTSVGGARRQADWTADAVRAVAIQFIELSPVTLDDGDWGIESVRFERMASVDRNDATDPPYWQVSDACVIRITRARKRGSV